ncbi:MAG: sigma-54-dependent Fis family transcriptional regulator [Gemmatimonadota bacterium]|nr:MAG: sigma-54-dependent Fis family transcriptional regulator [Gemmatimonadota bacterium]
MKRVLIIEPDTRSRNRTQGALESLPCDVQGFEGPADAIRAMMEEMPSLVITRGNEPSEEDLHLLRIARAGHRPVPVLVLADNGNRHGAISYMDAGAYDYVANPSDPNELRATVDEILRLASADEEPGHIAMSEGDHASESQIVGRSPEMIEIFKMIGRVAKSDAAVLIQGESGTGKELVARTIHETSRRAEKPFLAVNCAAIPDTLLESELFGHEKGAFTGATYSRKGKFELSHGGTIFLDEIGDMSLPTQAKILRVLQEHTFERVGGEQTLASDTRIIAATNKSLVKCIEDHQFRVDLFYRLKVVSIFLPALRKRPGDLTLLIDHFVRKYRQQAKVPIRGISQRAQAMLEVQEWTGNVRELENTIQTAVVLNRTGSLECEDFPFLRAAPNAPSFDSGEGSLDRLRDEARKAARVLLMQAGDSTDCAVYRQCVDVMESALVEMALERFEGNQVRASKALGISRNTLRSKMGADVDRGSAAS